MSELFPRDRIQSSKLFQAVGYTKGFTCPSCKSFSSHYWNWSLKHKALPVEHTQQTSENVVISARCAACYSSSIWLKNLNEFTEDNMNFEKIIFPSKSNDIDDPNLDMPCKVKVIYQEASSIISESPRASAALSRLAIEYLVDELNAEGKSLNQKIGYLVSKGLPKLIQQSLDTVRVIGNNAVHPGQIDFDDDDELAHALLQLINIIVDNQISQPKMIGELYNSLPKNALKGITDRDKKAHS